MDLALVLERLDDGRVRAEVAEPDERRRVHEQLKRREHVPRPSAAQVQIAVAGAISVQAGEQRPAKHARNAF